MNDLKFALRQLLKNPGFTAVAVLTLALGIGANTAIFSVVHGVLLAPLPFPAPERLVRIHETVPARGADGVPVSPPTFLDWRNQSSTFESLSAMTYMGYNLTGQGEARRLNAARVSANFFQLLGVNPVNGRAFAPEEETVGRHRVAIVSRAMWQGTFGGDPAVVGRIIQLDGEGYEVVGVVPDRIGIPSSKTELWTPAAFSAEELADRGSRYLQVIGRLKQGVSHQEAASEMQTISARLAGEHEESKDFSSSLIGLHEETVGTTRRPLLVLLGAVACVLLIACANVANLLLARATARSREFALRTSLGAGRVRILRQLVTEGLLLSLVAGGLGLLLGRWGVTAIVALAPSDLPRMAGISMNSTVLAFSLVIAVGTGLVCGMAPAISAWRTDLNEVLKEHGRGLTEGFRRNRIRSALVVGEIALSLVLLAGAGLLLRSFAMLYDVDPGFQPSNLLTANLALPERKYPTAAIQAATFQRIVAEASALPGVRSASAVFGLPYGGMISKSSLSIEGRPPPKANEPNIASYRQVTPGYFKTIGATLLRGRDFDARDTANAPRTVLVNESFTRAFFPGLRGDEVIGQRIDCANDLWEIIGIVRDFRDSNLAEPAEPQMFLPIDQSCWGLMSLVVRTDGDPAILSESLRQTVARIDPELPLENIRPMATLLDGTLAERRLQTGLLAAFAVLALVLSAVGIHGVMACSVSQRIQEIGIRMALGAQLGDVIRMVLRQGAVLTGLGVAFGLAGGLALARLLAGLLYEIRPHDPPTFGFVSAVLIVVALMACWIPAHRASRVNPMVALRSE
ncbi:MAG: ABC transporter permease [Verrucomicrobiae bacterium]|nr:ABC transporter permease [Verrucomicrobiae bacterium]